jgi:hypothetical protein
VLHLLAEGRVREEIGKILGVSVMTVEFHKQKLTEKLGLHTDAALTAYPSGTRSLRPSKRFVIEYPARSRAQRGPR